MAESTPHDRSPAPQPATDASEAQNEAEQPQFALSSSRQFPEWLAESGASLAFTTYQAGKLFFIGTRTEEFRARLSIFERNVERCMGMWASSDALWVASLFQLWRFENVLGGGERYEDYDALYAPRQSWVTGDLDVHDVEVDRAGRPVFVNTLFSCLATVGEGASFRPLWQPPFISRLAAEDRCHMNGVAMRDGRPAFVTAVARSDVADGWRDHRRDGGVVIDVDSGEIVASGLSMPHSPRWHDGQLFVVNAGSGELGRIDLDAAQFEPVCFCPGYLRGLEFLGSHALVTLSLPRENRTFSGLALDDQLASRGAEPRCGLRVVNLRSGDAVHWVTIEGVVSELYDVRVIAGIERPAAIGFKTQEVRRVISVGEPAPLDP